MSTLANISLGRSTVGKVRVTDLDIDPRVQREEGTDERRCDRMAATFNSEALGLFIVSQRENGDLILLDGAHRRATCLKVGWNAPVDALVFHGLSLAEEAQLFLLYNDKKDPSAVSRFMRRVVAGDAVAMTIDRIIRKHGWRVARSAQSAGQFTAVDAVERVYRSASRTLPQGEHPDVLDQVITIVTEAWGHDPYAVSAPILEGLAQLIGRFGKSMDVAKVIRELEATQPRKLISQAKTLRDIQGGNVPAALAKIVAGLHNKKRRNNLLPEWVWVR